MGLSLNDMRRWLCYESKYKGQTWRDKVYCMSDKQLMGAYYGIHDAHEREMIKERREDKYIEEEKEMKETLEFTPEGLILRGNDEYLIPNKDLEKYKVNKGNWRGSYGTSYWRIGEHGQIVRSIDQRNVIANWDYDSGNYFETQLECKIYREKLVLTREINNFVKVNGLAKNWAEMDNYPYSVTIKRIKETFGQRYKDMTNGDLYEV